MKALRNFDRIALEPIEDIAFNVRYIAVIEPSHQESGIIFGASFSFPILPGVIFLGGSALKDPAKLLESIYHETLHAKFVNTYHAYDLLRFEMMQDIERFMCPWALSSEDKEWHFMRVAAAYHVYCHLLAFHRLVVHRHGPYSEWSTERISTAREKLQILLEYIDKSRSHGVLTELGIQYFDLLGVIGEM